MRKAITLFLVIVMLVGAAGAAVSQDAPDLPGVASVGNNPSSAVQIDLGYLLVGLASGGFGIGGAYEFGITENISAKAMGGFISWSAFGHSASLIDVYGMGRYYIWPVAVNGLYIGAGAGATIASWSWDDESDSSLFPGVLAEVGYKFTLQNDGQGGFFLEPFLGFQQTFGTMAGIAYSAGGARYGLALGWSF